MNNIDNIISKIKNKKMVVGIMGLGYVGLPLALAAADKGFKVIGFDINKERIDKLLSKDSYIKDVPPQKINKLINKKLFIPTNNEYDLAGTDIVIVCVPTPLNKTRKPDLRYIKKSAYIISDIIKENHIIIVESTTYPGTTKEVFQKIIESSGLVVDENIFLAFSPERIDPANKDYSVINTPKIVGGTSADSSLIVKTFYEKILDGKVVTVSNPDTAEMSKILENSYRLINIALMCELTKACEKLNINIWEVIEAAKTKPYGFQAFYPGPGIGGHCIPIDPLYLTWKMQKLNLSMPLLKKASDITNDMPKYIVKRTKKILGKKGKKLSKSKILIIGVTYKKDVDDLRESPSLKLIDYLEKERALISYYDPYIPNFIHNGKEYISSNLDGIEEFDIVIIAVDHSNINYKKIKKHSKVIFDLKNTMFDVKDRRKVYLL